MTSVFDDFEFLRQRNAARRLKQQEGFTVEEDGVITHPNNVTESVRTITTFRADGTISQQITTPRRDNDVKFINNEAKQLATEILAGRRTEGLREQVETAVTHLSELFAGAGDGSVFSFARELESKTWHYAAIKSGGKWYSTGSVTALQGADDDELITWLIGLEIYEESNLLAIAKTSAPALIEGTVADET